MIAISYLAAEICHHNDLIRHFSIKAQKPPKGIRLLMNRNKMFGSFPVLTGWPLKELPQNWNCLAHYHTMLHFDALKIYRRGKHCEKRRNCNKPFLLFSHFFLSCMALIFHFRCTLKVCFNLDQSKTLSSCNGLSCRKLIKSK